MSSLILIIVIYNYGLLFDKPPLRKLYHKDSVTSVKFDPSSGRAVVSAIADGQVIIISAYDANSDKDGTVPFDGVIDKGGEILFKFKSLC